MIELLYEILQSVERTRGSPQEAEQVKRLVIQPLQQIVACVTTIVVVVGAIVVAVLLSGKSVDLGPDIGKVGSEWIVSGSAILTLILALLRGRIRNWRRSRSLGPGALPLQRDPEQQPDQPGVSTTDAALEPAPDKQGAAG